MGWREEVAELRRELHDRLDLAASVRRELSDDICVARTQTARLDGRVNALESRLDDLDAPDGSARGKGVVANLEWRSNNHRREIEDMKKRLAALEAKGEGEKAHQTHPAFNFGKHATTVSWRDPDRCTGHGALIPNEVVEELVRLYTARHR